jgi:hypothetical protein
MLTRAFIALKQTLGLVNINLSCACGCGAVDRFLAQSVVNQKSALDNYRLLTDASVQFNRVIVDCVSIIYVIFFCRRHATRPLLNWLLSPVRRLLKF